MYLGLQRGMLCFRFRYKKGETFHLEGFSDRNYTRDGDDRSSASGAFFFTGGNVVTWVSQKQRLFASSVKQSMWLSLVQHAKVFGVGPTQRMDWRRLQSREDLDAQ